MMKKIILVLSVLCVFGFSVQAQVSVNQEFRRVLDKGTQGVGLGFSVQYLYSIEGRFSAGANVGFIYDVGLENQEFIKRFSIPMLAIGRYYITGDDNGGFYSQLELGAEILRMKVDFFATKETFKNTYGKTQVSLGYRFGERWEIGARFGLLLSNDPISKYVGIRSGLNF